MKPLPLEIPLPSLQISDNRIINIAKIFAEIITEETAELLDRLADHAEMAYDYSLFGSARNSNIYLEDEEAALALAVKIRELLRLRDK